MVLTLEEWAELNACASDFCAALQVEAHQGRPELLEAVYSRLSAALRPVQERIVPQGDAEKIAPKREGS